MDKTIDINVNGSYLRKNSNIAGIQGEGNATVLHLTFDESWAELAKTVTFWDSRGENPVKRTLTADLLTDIAVSLLEYNVPIPSEPMAHAGWMSFVIDGYLEGKRMRGAETELLVEEAKIDDDAGEPADPTPTQAEQLQEQVEKLLGDVQEETVKAQTAAESASLSAAEAEESASEAIASKENARVYETNARLSAEIALAAQVSAEEAQASAETAKDTAVSIAGGVLYKADKDNVIEKDSTVEYTPTADTHPANKGYVDNAIANKVSELGAGDMQQSVYDTQGKKTDIFKYVDDAVSNIDISGADFAPSDHTHTAEGVGALPLTGGTLTGRLEMDMSNGTLGEGKVFKNNGADDYGTKIEDYDADGNSATLILSAKNQYLKFTKNGTAYNIYGEHNITKTTTDLTAGTSTLATGVIHLVYE